MTDRDYGGSPGTPIQLRSHAPRQTEESPRYRQSRQPLSTDGETPDAWTVDKTPNSAYRYDYRKNPSPKKTKVMPERRLDRTSLVLFLCIVVIVMIGGWLAFNALANWWTNWQNDLHYGNPRTFQTDQFVGQGDSSTYPDHFIVVNINGRVVVVQLNLAHPELDHSYAVTTTDPKTPVSLSFRQTGNTLAMYVLIETTTPYTVELVSNGKQFVSPH